MIYGTWFWGWENPPGIRLSGAQLGKSREVKTFRKVQMKKHLLVFVKVDSIVLKISIRAHRALVTPNTLQTKTVEYCLNFGCEKQKFHQRSVNYTICGFLATTGANSLKFCQTLVFALTSWGYVELFSSHLWDTPHYVQLEFLICLNASIHVVNIATKSNRSDNNLID